MDKQRMFHSAANGNMKTSFKSNGEVKQPVHHDKNKKMYQEK